MNSEILSIVFVLLAVTLILGGAIGLLRRSAVRHPILTGTAVGLVTGPLVAFQIAKQMDMITLLGFIGTWAAYTLVWIACCSLFVRIYGGASNAT